MQIKVVQTSSAKDFERDINIYLNQGWKFHGPPFINTVTKLFVWNGAESSQIVTTYIQILVK